MNYLLQGKKLQPRSYNNNSILSIPTTCKRNNVTFLTFYHQRSDIHKSIITVINDCKTTRGVLNSSDN